jgi:purine-binding chemotaxis protein CheW
MNEEPIARSGRNQNMPATLTAPSGALAAKADSRAGKYITFRLGSEEFAIGVLRIREIVGVQKITAVPHTPLGVKGVINLRGKVIPVVDLRLKFGLPELEHTERTCIIVAQIELGQSMLVGAIVDGVSEVLTVQAADIEDTPDFGPGIRLPYLLCMAKIKGQVKILLDIQAALATRDLAELGSF